MGEEEEEEERRREGPSQKTGKGDEAWSRSEKDEGEAGEERRGNKGKIRD